MSDDDSVSIVAQSVASASRRQVLVGAAVVAGSLALAPSRKARAAGRTEITFASAKFFGKETIAEVVEAYNPVPEQGSRHLRGTAAAEFVDRGASGAGAAAGARNGTPDVFTQDVVWIAEFAGAGWALPLDSIFPRRPRRNSSRPDRRLHLPQQADCAAVVRRFRHALLPHGPAGGSRRPRCRRPGSDWSKTAQALQKGGKAKFGYLWQGKQAEVLVCDAGRGDRARTAGRSWRPTARPARLNSDEGASRPIQFLYDTINKTKISPSDVLSWDEEPSRAAVHRRATRHSCATGPTCTASRRIRRHPRWSARSASRHCRISPAARAPPASAATSMASTQRPRTGRPRSTS